MPWKPTFVFVLILSLILPGTAAFAETVPVPDKSSIAVLDFEAKGDVQDDEASIISDRVRTELFKSGHYRILERSNMLSILKEQGFQQSQSNCQGVDCSVEIGRLLAVKQIVTGSVSKLGSIYTLSLRIVDVEKGIIVQDEYRDCRCNLEEVLTETTLAMVYQLTHKEPKDQISNLEEAASLSLNFRENYYQEHRVAPLLSLGFNAVPMAPAGFIYLNQWDQFWGYLGLEAGLILTPIILSQNPGLRSNNVFNLLAIGTLLSGLVVYAYSLYDVYMNAEAKNEAMRKTLRIKEFAYRPAFQTLHYGSSQHNNNLIQWQLQF